MQSTTIGIDLAKSVFQISVADSHHHIVKRQRLNRSQFQLLLVHTPPAKLVMEGCASAHHWGRFAEQHGHRVTLLHARYVRAYVRRNQTDAADAVALIRAAQDRDLIPIAIKSEHQQALQSLHRIRAQWQSTRIARINEARGLLAEFGIVLPRGSTNIGRRLHAVIEQLSELLQLTLAEIVSEIADCQDKLKRLDKTLKQQVEQFPIGQQLLAIPGIGPTIASAALGRVSNIHAFKSGRTFASWLGITPREYSFGSTRRLGHISRKGDTYLRMLLIHCARSALLAAKRARARNKKLTELQHWTLATEARIGHNKASVALANKMARILWAVCTRNTDFNGDHSARYH